MNFDYNAKNPYDDDLFANDLNSANNENVVENLQQNGLEGFAENHEETKIPYSPNIILIGVPQLKATQERVAEIETSEFSEPEIKLFQEALVEQNPLIRIPEKKISNYSRDIKEDIRESADLEKIMPKDISVDRPKKGRIVGVPRNIKEIQEGKEKKVVVDIVDLDNPKLHNLELVEAAEKAYRAGMLVLYPKKEGDPFEVQEELGKILKENDVSEVEAIMPSGEHKVFKQVQFQTITGSTSKELSLAFEQLSTAIYYARLQLIEEEKRKKREELIEAAQRQNNSSLNEILKSKKTDNIEPIKEIKGCFKFCFIKIGNQILDKLEDSKKADEKIKEEKNQRESDEKAHDINEKDIKKRYIKSDNEKRDIKTQATSDETEKKTENSLKTEKTEKGKKIKEKVKLHPASDPDAPPIDIIDNTREKRPI